MNEEIDNTGTFLQDFTAVSDWEILTLRVEEVISLWKLSEVPVQTPLQAGDISSCSWDIWKESIDVNNISLSVFRYRLKTTSTATNIDLSVDSLEDDGKKLQVFMDLGNDTIDFDALGQFTDNLPNIASWYGLRHFVVVKSNALKDVRANYLKILMSAINIAINNTGCEVPIFVQCLESWQEYYIGICDYKDLCIKFDTIHLQKTPNQCYYLVGLLDIFKGKIASSVPLNSVQISAQFSYDMTDATSFMWMQEPPDFDFLQGKTLGISNYLTIPFGSVSDPMKSFYLHVSWLRLSEDTVVDSQTYTDLDPSLAPFWNLQIEHDKENPGLLFKFVEAFIDLHKFTTSVISFIEETYNVHEPLGGSLRIPRSALPLSKSEGEPFLKEKKYYNSVSYDVMKSILHFIFYDPTADPDVSQSERKGLFALSSDTLKGSYPNDVVWRLAVVSAHISQVMGDSHALAHVWYEFIQELRSKWYNAVIINRVADGYPNTRTCLLHQKLQMLNVCIERRKAREATAAEHLYEEEGSSESEDEFFECDDNSADDSSEAKTNLVYKPVGRKDKFGNEKLIETHEQIYIPVTQEPVPKTEDQQEESEDMLTLGEGVSHSDTIAQIMSASLLSDMSAFKAANPGSIFEDFIRWYSPRDWIESDDGTSDETDSSKRKCHLSARMLIPNNMWIEVWRTSKPMPAKKQKRLFDDTKEGECILHFLETRNVSQIVELLLPSLTQAVLEKLGSECETSPELPQLEASYDRLKSVAIKLTREKAGPDKYKVLLEHISRIETAISQSRSVKNKLDLSGDQLSDEVKEFLKSLISRGQAKVPGNARGQIGSKVISLFKNAAEERVDFVHSRENFFPTPVQKEFVLRVKAHRPSAYSSSSLQMMRAILRPNSCRLLGAFSEDTVFT